MNQSSIGWIALAVAVFVYLDLLFVELRRMGREGKRILTRVIAYGDLPVIAQAERTGDDADRIARALDATPLLIERARVALAAIRDPRGVTYEPRVPNGSDASNGLSPDWASGGSQVQP